MISVTTISAIMLLFSLCGFTINWAIVIIMIKVTKLQKPFAILTVGLAIADGTFSALYLFYATPMVFFESDILSNYSSVCGYVLMICYSASTTFHFMISLNRILAVYKPMLYRMMFSVLFTFCIVMGIYSYALTIITLFFQILGCQNFYDQETRAFRYSGGDVCRFYATYLDFYLVFSLTISSTILDFLAIGKVLKISSKTEKHSKELSLLKQSISQTLFVLAIVCSFTWGPRFIPDIDYTFIFSSILWSSVHMFDGFFTLIFNPEIRRSCSRSGQPLAFNVVRSKSAALD